MFRRLSLGDLPDCKSMKQLRAREAGQNGKMEKWKSVETHVMPLFT
jgi:hypothetical protein